MQWSGVAVLVWLACGCGGPGPITVRTINFETTRDQYPERMQKIAKKVANDRQVIGGERVPELIGMEELREKMTKCQGGGLWETTVTGARCFAALQKDLGQGTFGWFFDGVSYPGWFDPDEGGGAAWSDGFEVLQKNRWNIGPGIEGTTNYDRYLIEVELLHQKSKRRLRFYVTHFYPGHTAERREYRKVQASELIEKVLARATDGDLPPLLVGDFNFDSFEEDGSILLNGHFTRAPVLVAAACGSQPDSAYDIVYVAKKSSFPRSKGTYRLGRLRKLTLNPDLSDHNSLGQVMWVEPKQEREPWADPAVACP